MKHENHILFATVALGCSSVITQLALMRELLGAFGGNELVLGLSLGLWLLFMGVGSWFGCRVKSRPVASFVLGLSLVWLAMTPLAQVFLLRACRDVVFLRGAAVGVLETAAAAGVLLLPYCLVAGLALAVAGAVLAAVEKTRGVGRVYAADSVGSILGGLLFSFVLAGRVDHIALLVWPGLVNLAAAVALAARAWRAWVASLIGGAALALVAGIRFLNPDAVSTARQYTGQRVMARVSSPYGRLVVTESAGQINFFENGLLLCSTQDRQTVEETVHYALAQRPGARRVLLVGGGFSGTVGEVLKYDVVALDYVELDPKLLDLGKQFLPGLFADARLRLIPTDGRRFIQQAGRSGERYDVVILDLPAPLTAQLNRLYTAEFFAEVKRVLADDGVMSCALGAYANFVSPELGRLLSSARGTLATSFAHVRLLPGGRVYFLAADGPLSEHVAARLEARHIKTDWVNRHSLEGLFTPDRMADLARAAAQPADVNRDADPVLYYYHLRHWLSQFNTRLGWLPGLLAIPLAVYLVRLPAPSLVVFASGFAASALELVLLLMFQTLCGSMYQQVGILFTVFMAGLASGAGCANRFLVRPLAPAPGETLCDGSRQPGRLAWACLQDGPIAPRGALTLLAFALTLFALLLPMGFPLLRSLVQSSSSRVTVELGVAGLTFLLAWLVGMQFPLASQLEPDPPTAVSRLYTADFVGASLGALLAGTVMVPVAGLFGVCLVTAGLSLIAACRLCLGTKQV